MHPQITPEVFEDDLEGLLVDMNMPGNLPEYWVKIVLKKEYISDQLNDYLRFLLRTKFTAGCNI
jgi:hypothetical protein